MRKKLVSTLGLLLLLQFSFACGEPEQENQGGNQSNTENQIPGDGNNGDSNGGDGDGEDCPEGELLNPFTGECQEDTSDGDGDGGGDTDCPAGEALDPITGNCEPDEDACDEGEAFDAQLGECVEDIPSDCTPGSILGQACAPSGQFLATADVIVTGLDCNGEVFTRETVADGQGNYSFDDIPPGAHELLVSSGSFSGNSTIQIFPGGQLDLTGDADKVCVSSEDVKIMVFQGSNESMTTLLDNLEIEYETIGSNQFALTAALLQDLPALFEYDILFFECNHSWISGTNAGDRPTIISNLQQFVQSGRSLYAADNAYQWVDEPFPNLANFGGTANSSEVIMADVISSDMLSLLGATEVEIDFDLSGMRVLDSVDPTITLHFRGTRSGVPGRPLMYSYREPINGGTVIYTSFHSSAQGTASQEILDILNFIIFQL